MAHILLVEDDGAIAKNLTYLLEGEGYTVTVVHTQKDAIEALETGSFDLFLLDLSLPDGSGYTICSAAKRQGDTPVIFLTATDEEASVVTGFELGADDYITKPFRPMELLSRIKNALRRHGGSAPIFELGGLKVDTVKGSVSKNGKEVFLSALEYRLLLTLIATPGKIYTRGELLDSIWDAGGDFVTDNTLTVYIKRLREKIEDDPGEPAIIKTVRGLGYRVGETR